MYQENLDWALDMLERSLFIKDSPIGPYVTHAYNVFGATDQPATKSSIQPICYGMHNATIFLKLGLQGQGIFATREFQEAYARTLFLSMMNGPYPFLGTDKDGVRVSGTSHELHSA